MKKCFKCLTVKPLDDYYKHPQMGDGHLNKCKECAKQDAKVGRVPRTCFTCGKDFKAVLTEVNRGGAITCSRECFYKRLPIILEERNANKQMTYESVHHWVKRKNGKPALCENCGSTDKKAYDWANISGDYKRDLNDWKRLCRSCHLYWDRQPERRGAYLRKIGVA